MIPPEVWLYTATLFTSLLTLLSGFGLGTILTPVFALFYDVKLAILLVAIIHFMNNVLKFSLFRKHVDWKLLQRFGLVSVAGALLGAVLQAILFSEWIKIFLGVILVILGIVEFIPERRAVRLPRKIDIAGGFISGLLGGLVGNQGAIRSAYMLNYDLTKESFIGTATVIALLIDATRIPIYLTTHAEYFSQIRADLLIVVAIAFTGTIVGKRLLRNISPRAFKKIVAGFVVIVGIAFLSGIV